MTSMKGKQLGMRIKEELKLMHLAVKRFQNVLGLDVMKLRKGMMMPVTQLTQVVENPTKQFASPSNLKMEPYRKTVLGIKMPLTGRQGQSCARRGGWNVHGGLFGGSPHSPNPGPVFANSDSNESEDSSKKCFVGDTDSSDDSDSELCSDSVHVRMNLGCDPLPTIYAENKIEKIKVSKFSVKCECENKCDEAAINLTDDVVIQMKAKFVGESLTKTKNLLLSHLKAQSDILDTVENGFYYGGHSFCLAVFSKLTGISPYILRKVQEAHKQGLIRFVHNNSRMPKNSPRKVNAICWFKSFCQIYGQRAPDVILVVLPSWLDIITVFDMYKQENPVKSEQIKYSTFAKMMKTDFGPRRPDRSLPRVRFSKWSSHSVCTDCYDLDAFQRTCRTEKDINLCRALKYKHRERYSKQQMCITSMRHLSQTFPEQHFSLFIDSMDNMKSHIPRLMEKTKKLANFWKLPSKITGCILYSSHYPMNRKIKMYINFDQFEQGEFVLQ